MTSPFADGRFEHEAKHIYYLPKSCFDEIERARPTYLIGSRGSGKTTLMKALHWEERLDNATLRRQLNGDPFRGNFIASYVKLPKIQLNTFDAWLGQGDETTYGLLFGLYIDLTCLELVAHSVADLLARGSISVSPLEESKAVFTWLNDYPEFQQFGNGPPPDTVSAFRIRIRDIRRALEREAMQRMDPPSTLSRLPADQIGNLSTAIASKLAALCDADLQQPGRRWHFKVCMDEGESLSGIQQRVINTLVRLSEWPLFHVVSYVSRPDDMTTTMALHLTQQKADRQVIVLDDMDRPAFEELAEGVATVRCQERLQSTTATFDTKTILGTSSLNRILRSLLERSENPRAKEVLEGAKAFAGEYAEANDLPIVESYLYHELALPEEASSRREQRRIESTQYRKKFVAAFLSICRELKVRHVPYASADVVFGTSDNCVRDFLSQVDHLLRESGKQLEAFLGTEMNWESQSRAIRRASEEKADSIPTSGVLSPVETGRVVKGLAIVTAAIQSSSSDKRHLRSTERGWFAISSKSDPSAIRHALALVHDAADAGFLRIGREGELLGHFRVHASLAPAFNFSYRGAYYPVVLTLDEFNALRNAETDDRLDKVASAIADRMSKQPDPQLPLFEGTAQ